MGSYVVDLPDLVIANSGTSSGAVGSLDDADVLTLYSPSALTGTLRIQVERTDSGTTWVDLQSGGADINIGVDEAVSITDIGFRQVRITSASAQGAERTFNATKQVLM